MTKLGSDSDETAKTEVTAGVVGWLVGWLFTVLLPLKNFSLKASQLPVKGYKI